jgi:hypothetical protein
MQRCWLALCHVFLVLALADPHLLLSVSRSTCFINLVVLLLVLVQGQG